MAEGAADNIGAVELAIQAALDAASWNAAQAAAQQQGRIIGTQLAKAIQDTVARQPIAIKPQIVGGADLSGVRQSALSAPPVPPPIPPAYLQQMAAAQAATAGVNTALGGTAAAATTAATSVGGLSGAVGLLQAAFAGFLALQAVQAIRQVGNQSQASKIQLEALAGTYGELGQAQEAVTRIASVLNISNLEARQGFAQLYAALRGTGVGIQQIEVLFVGLNNAARLSGAGAAEAAGALLQLKQALSSGRLSGDELRSVLEAMPILTQRLAEGLGVSVGQIKELGSQGKITSDVVFNAAKALAAEAVPAKTATDNLAAAFTNLNEKVAEAFGPSTVAVASKLAGAVAVLAKALEDNQDNITNTVSGIAQIGKVIVPLVVGIKAAELAMKGYTAATKAAAGAQLALQALSGPKGWIALAAGILVAAGAYKTLDAALAGVDKAYEEIQAKNEAERQKFLQELPNIFFNGPTPGPSEKDVEKLAKQRGELEGIEASRARILRQTEAEAGLADQINSIYDDRTATLSQQEAAVAAITSGYARQAEYLQKLQQLDELRAKLAERQRGQQDADLERFRNEASQPTKIERLYAEGGDRSGLNQLQKDLDEAYGKIATTYNKIRTDAGQGQGRIDPRIDPTQPFDSRELTRRINEQRQAGDAAGRSVQAAGNKAAQAVTTAGEAAAGSVENVGDAIGAAVDTPASKALAAAIQFAKLQEDEAKLVQEIKAQENAIGNDLTSNLRQATAQLRGEVLTVDASPINAASRQLAANFEVSTAQLAEVYDFASQVFAEFGSTGTTVYEQLRQVFGQEGVALAERFNTAFAAAREAADTLAQAASQLQGSRVNLEREGLISQSALAEGIQNALSQIAVVRQGNADLDQNAVQAAIQAALNSQTPLANLSSLASTLTTSKEATLNFDQAAAVYKDATEKATVAQNNLTAAINNLLPQINVAVTVPNGSQVASNAPMRYA